VIGNPTLDAAFGGWAPTASRRFREAEQVARLYVDRSC
jgi:hypothetical protein